MVRRCLRGLFAEAAGAGLALVGGRSLNPLFFLDRRLNPLFFFLPSLLALGMMEGGGHFNFTVS